VQFLRAAGSALENLRDVQGFQDNGSGAEAADRQKGDEHVPEENVRVPFLRKA